MKKCNYCEVEMPDDDLRPYGENASLICFPCMTADPARVREAERQFNAQMDAILGPVAIGSSAGPIPIRHAIGEGPGEDS